jgi:hypothetical protein
LALLRDHAVEEVKVLKHLLEVVEFSARDHHELPS